MMMKSDIGALMVGMIAILVTWVIAHITFTGMGFLALRAFNLRSQHASDYWRSFWFGWAIVIGIAQIWNFFFPINNIFRVLILIIGIASYLLHIARLKPALKRIDPAWFILAMFLSVAGIWFANHALSSNFEFDDGLYRLQVVKWFAEYAVVPGLGHLHDRLAFSNGFFYYPALYQFGFWEDRVSHVTNGILHWTLLATVATNIFCLFRKQERYIYQYISIPLFFVIILASVSSAVHEISNDRAVLIMGYLCVLYTWQFIEQKQTLSDREALYHLSVLACLASIGIVAKFSFGVIGVLLTVIAFGSWVWEKSFNLKPFSQGLAVCLISALFVLIPMLIRSSIQTGYVLYPVTTFGAVPVEWRLDPQKGTETMRWIEAWGREPRRHPDDVLNTMDWFPGWWQGLTQNIVHFRIPIALFSVNLVGAMLLLTSQLRQPRPKSDRLIEKLVLYTSITVAAILAIAFWFLSAPNFRFLGALSYTFAFSPVVLFLSLMPHHKWRILWTLIVSLALAYLSFRQITLNLWQMPANNPTGLYPPTEAIDPQVIETDTFFYYVPEAVAVPNSGQCWSHPLPCTLIEVEGLELRQPGNLQSGFIIGDDVDANVPGETSP